MSQNTSTNPPNDGDANANNKISSPFPSAAKVRSNLEKIRATPEQINSALWLLDFAKANRLPTYKALGDAIDRDASAASKLFAGTYGADLKSLIAQIDRFRATLSERAGFGERVIVQTSVMSEVRTLCELTRASQTMALLFGKNQSGKTTALEEYSRETGQVQTVLVRMPVGGGAKMFLIALMRACGLGTSRSMPYDQMIDATLRFFGYRGQHQPPTRTGMLLVVDEVHQAMIGRSVKTTTMELIRQIHDLCKIGVVLCGTDVLPEIIQDERFARLLGQIDNRGVLRRRIPAVPSKSDIRKICRAYGFGDPEGKSLDIVQRISSANGIGKLCGYLRMSKKLAANRHQTPDWTHFLTTHATLLSWERGDRQEPKQLVGGSQAKALEEKGGQS